MRKQLDVNKIKSEIDSGNCTLEEMAKFLGMTEQELRKKLNAEDKDRINNLLNICKKME